MRWAPTRPPQHPQRPPLLRGPATSFGPAPPTIPCSAENRFMNMSFDLHPAPRVLHVDRDEDSAVVLATLLAPEIQVVHASSYSQAQNQLQHGEFALLVIDPDLPD